MTSILVYYNLDYIDENPVPIRGKDEVECAGGSRQLQR